MEHTSELTSARAHVCLCVSVHAKPIGTRESVRTAAIEERRANTVAKEESEKKQNNRKETTLTHLNKPTTGVPTLLSW